MKATELIKKLEEEIKSNGDSDVYFEYDSGIRISCRTTTFVENIGSNAHSPHWPIIKKGIIINYDPD